MSVVSTVVWTLLAPVVLVMWMAGAPGAMKLFTTAVWLTMGFPWLMARAVAIPLGWVRPAWLLGWLAEVVWRKDRLGGAAATAAWALARRRRESLKLAVWVDRRLEKLAPLGGAGVLAAGLAAGARGETAVARRLIASVGEFAERARPKLATWLAAEWLAGDAAAGGDWEEVRRRASMAPTATGRLLALVAERVLGGAVPAWRLRLAWLLAPRRRHLRPLVERALAARPVAAASPPAATGAAATPAGGHPYREASAPTDARLREALAAHLAMVSAGAPRGGALGAIADGWDAALADASTRRYIGERARIVGARSEAVLGELSAAVEQHLAELALTSGEPISGSGPVASGAARRLRERLLADVERAARSLQTRVQSGRALPAIHEWRETLALRDLVERGGRLGGLPLRRLVFEDVHSALCPLACRLWNDRGQRIVADALFRWLLGEAEAVGHARLAEHERRNVNVR